MTETKRYLRTWSSTQSKKCSNSMKPIIRPTSKQHEAWEILRDKQTSALFFGGGAGGGKSWLGCEWAITNTYFYPNSKGFIARKELKRLMLSTYITFQKV